MEPSRAPRRLPALDGLRGIAAIVVLLHHLLMINPALSRSYDPISPVDLPVTARIFAFTPLHLAWAGTEAVQLFFVLSGFVLALPSVHGRQVPWRNYYPQRLVRLYLPIVAAVAFAVVALHIGSRAPQADRSSWLNGHPASAALGAIAHDAIVVFGAGTTNDALWSLQWEVIFSLLLPLYAVVFVRVLARPVLPVVLVTAALVAGAATNSAALFNLAIFGVGVVMARQHAALERWGARADRAAPGFRVAIAAAVVLLFTAGWMLRPLGYHPHIGELASVAASAVAVWCFAFCRGARGLGSRPAVQWVGKRSFSLYLVHEPVVVTTAVLLGHHVGALSTTVIALPLSLLAAAVFFRVVEAPSHRLARWFGAARTGSAPVSGGDSAAWPKTRPGAATVR